MIVKKMDVVISEAELRQWVLPLVQKQEKVKDVVIRCGSGTLEVDGTIALQFDIPVQTKWRVSPLEGQRVAVTLVAVSTSFFGLGGEMLRVALMKALANFLPAIDDVQIIQDALIVNVGARIKRYGIVAERDFSALTVEPGTLRIEL